MKKVAVITLIVVAGVFVWSIANRLSADAIGLALGILLGVMAGIPTALLVLAAGRRRTPDAEDEDLGERHAQGRNGYPYPMFPQQPPVIVLTGPAPQQPQGSSMVDSYAYPARGALPGPAGLAGERAFKVVGEQEEWLDDF